MSNRENRISSVVSFLLISTSAFAQGPSFTEPDGVDLRYLQGHSMSSDGRYIAASNNNQFYESVFRWDTQTSHVEEIVVNIFGVLTPYNVIVLDNGHVLWDVNNGGIDDLHRIHRWIPGVRDDEVMPGPAGLFAGDFLCAASRDGESVLCRTWLSDTSAFVLDLTTSPPSRLPLHTVDGGFLNHGAGITVPINGRRIAYGNVEANGQLSGQSWLVPFVTPIPHSWLVVKTSPTGAYQIGKIGSTYYLFGDGPARQLDAPLFPVFYTDPVPAALSDDGSVIIGSALHPFGYREPVIWRKGLPPALFTDLLDSAEVSYPAWSGVTLNAISADGSVVSGMYREPQNLLDRIFRCVLPSSNDLCSGARSITYGTTVSSTEGATRSGVSGTCSAEANAPDVWFSFVPIANETITIDTCGSDFDTTLALYQTSNCNSIGTAIACNDDASPACSDNVFASRITANVFSGQNYFIRVSGWNGAFGSIRLSVTAPARPANDSCEQATVVNVPVGNAGSGAFFNNSNAITDTRPNCGPTPFNDIWFRAIPQESGRVTYSTCGSSINTSMQVYPGSACDNLNTPATACGSSSSACTAVGGGNGTRITVPCTPNVEQLVRVGGLFGSSGSGVFSARFACDENVLSSYNAAVTGTLFPRPLAYWRFDDSGSFTVADAIRYDPYSCGDWQGEYFGGPGRTNAYHNKALNLNGDGAHVRVETMPAIRIGETTSCASATLEAWIRTSDPYAGVVMTNRCSPSDHSLTLVVGYNPSGNTQYAGKVLFASDGPGTFFGTQSSVRVDDNKWHHVVAIRQSMGSGVYAYRLYIDAVWQGTVDFGAVGVHSGTGGPYWLIGNGTAWPTEGAAFNGQIDEVAIYCGALSPGYVNNHYIAGRPCPADINLDHIVDFFDYLDFVSAFSQNSPDADFNSDGIIDFFDYLDYLAAFTSPC